MSRFPSLLLDLSRTYLLPILSSSSEAPNVSHPLRWLIFVVRLFATRREKSVSSDTLYRYVWSFCTRKTHSDTGKTLLLFEGPEGPSVIEVPRIVSRDLKSARKRGTSRRKNVTPLTGCPLPPDKTKLNQWVLDLRLTRSDLELTWVLLKNSTTI